MKKRNFILILVTIRNLVYGSPSDFLPLNSPASFLLEEYCSKFKNISIYDVIPIVEFINLIPNTERESEIDKLILNERQDHFPRKSTFGLLQVLFPELKPKENKTLELADFQFQDCDICCESKVEYFNEGCGFGVCKNCDVKLGMHCPACRKYHRFAYNVTLYQLDKSQYPFVAIISPPEKPNFNENIKNVFSSLADWVGNFKKVSFLRQVNPFSKRRKLIEEQTKATIKILQIFDFLQHRSLWEFKEPLVILQLSVMMLIKMLTNADPNTLKKSSMSSKEEEEIDLQKQKFAKMNDSILELTYYIQWLSNTFQRQCYHVSNEPIKNEKKHIAVIKDFVKEFNLN